MSDISLYSGLYETIRRWADLVDDAIVNLKATKSSRAEEAYVELLSLLLSLATEGESGADFSDRRVASIIEGKLTHKVDWQELARQLQNPASQEATLPALEAIAECLADKHADTVAKMRWGLP
jgi:hypothetical protein